MSSELAQIYDIGELVDVTQGLAINSKTKHLLSDEGLPLLRITDLFSGSYSQFVAQEGVPKQCIANSEELIYTRTGQVGFVFTNKVGVVHNNCFKVTPKDDRLSRRYLYWYLRQESVRSYVNTVASGSVQKDLNHSAFKTLKIPLPDLEAQRKIDSILSALDDRISLLRATNTTLEAIAQALFKSWFVDFDPVHAKMQGRAPEGMDETTAALFPDSFEESALGVVPKGWRVGIISDLGEVICGKTPPTSNPENYGDDVPFITIPDMHNQLVVTNTGRSLSMTGANSQKKKNLPTGSICVSCIATPGLVVRVTRKSQTNQQINSVVPLPDWGKSFPLFLLRRIGDAVRSAGSGGSVFHNLSKSGFEAISVLLTSYELAQKFDELIEPLIARIEANQQQAANLAATRDVLLPRLISGRLHLDSMGAVDGC
jgi:type I restriction enzyme S subunit